MFKQILVPIDFGDASRQALEAALAVAGVHGSQLTVLHVCEIPPYVYEGMGFSPVDLLTPVSKAAEEHLDQVVAGLRGRHPGARRLFRVGGVSEEILAAIASQGCDLVVMGTHGRHGLAHAALGSVAEKVVRLSPVPVLTVHAGRA